MVGAAVGLLAVVRAVVPVLDAATVAVALEAPLLLKKNTPASNPAITESTNKPPIKTMLNPLERLGWFETGG